MFIQVWADFVTTDNSDHFFCCFTLSGGKYGKGIVCFVFFRLMKASPAKRHRGRKVMQIKLLLLFIGFGPTHTHTQICSSSLKGPQWDLCCSIGHFLRGPKAASPLNSHENLIRASLVQQARRQESLGNDTAETLTPGEHTPQINRE